MPKTVIANYKKKAHQQNNETPFLLLLNIHWTLTKTIFYIKIIRIFIIYNNGF